MSFTILVFWRTAILFHIRVGNNSLLVVCKQFFKNLNQRSFVAPDTHYFIPTPQYLTFLLQSDSESKDEDSSPERPARRGVTFRDTVETFPVSGRMDRLRRLLYEEAEEQRKQHTKVMRQTYRDQFKEIQQEQEREKALQQKRKMAVSTIHFI